MRLEPIEKLTKDIKDAAKTLSRNEIRFLVDNYYQIQEYRKGAFNQERSLVDSGEPHEIITWYAKESKRLENELKKALDAYSASQPIGVWSREILGIGPVIAAGLMAHIDIEKAPTVGHIWSFAGLDPTKEWKKGEKRPFNASLKTLCWKVGESFVKVSGYKDDIYGKYYLARKEQEVSRNINGDFSDQAEQKLKKYNIRKTTDAYKWYSGMVAVDQATKYYDVIKCNLEAKQKVNEDIERLGLEGDEKKEYKKEHYHPLAAHTLKLVEEGEGQAMLPPAHIQSRAKRYAVKLFLSHWHEQAYIYHFDTMPPNPYPIAILGHAHKIDRPGQ